MKSKIIRVDHFDRVEGEGTLFIKVEENAVADVKLQIVEPTRFFETFLKERHFTEVPDITARICNSCPISNQMTGIHAMEDICGVNIDEPLRILRRLIYCGEWIVCHGLHVYMLQAPDFLGFSDITEMARTYPDVAQRGLMLKKTGNKILTLLGDGKIYPENVCVGGFNQVPTKSELNKLTESLKWARDAALETVRWAAMFPFPEFERDYEFISLSHPDEYPFNEGLLVSSEGLTIPVSNYERYFIEERKSLSTEFESTMKGQDAYFVGPLARYNLNFDKLSLIAQEAAKEAGIPKVCHNPFQSIIIRSIEILYACDEALRLISEYEMPDRPAVDVQPRAGVGYGCTEASRGILYHRYCIDEDGRILDAKIVSPTSQNRNVIERDIYHLVGKYMDLPKEELTLRCEQAIQNYDPYVSCLIHISKLDMEWK